MFIHQSSTSIDLADVSSSDFPSMSARLLDCVTVCQSVICSFMTPMEWAQAHSIHRSLWPALRSVSAIRPIVFIYNTYNTNKAQMPAQTRELVRTLALLTGPAGTGRTADGINLPPLGERLLAFYPGLESLDVTATSNKPEMVLDAIVCLRGLCSHNASRTDQLQHNLANVAAPPLLHTMLPLDYLHVSLLTDDELPASSPWHKQFTVGSSRVSGPSGCVCPPRFVGLRSLDLRWEILGRLSYQASVDNEDIAFERAVSTLHRIEWISSLTSLRHVRFVGMGHWFDERFGNRGAYQEYRAMGAMANVQLVHYAWLQAMLPLTLDSLRIPLLQHMIYDSPLHSDAARIADKERLWRMHMCRTFSLLPPESTSAEPLSPHLLLPQPRTLPLAGSPLASTLRRLELIGVDLKLELALALPSFVNLSSLRLALPGCQTSWEDRRVAGKDLLLETPSGADSDRTFVVSVQHSIPTLAVQCQVFDAIAQRMPALCELSLEMSAGERTDMTNSTPVFTRFSHLALRRLTSRRAESDNAQAAVSSVSSVAVLFSLVSMSVDVARRDSVSGRQEAVSQRNLPTHVAGHALGYEVSAGDLGPPMPEYRASRINSAMFRRMPSDRAQAGVEAAPALPVDSRCRMAGALCTDAPAGAGATHHESLDDWLLYCSADGRVHLPPYSVRLPHQRPPLRHTAVNTLLEEEVLGFEMGAVGSAFSDFSRAGPNRFACEHQLHHLLLLPSSSSLSSLTKLSLSFTHFHPTYITALSALHQLVVLTLVDRITEPYRTQWAASSAKLWAAIGCMTQLHALRIWLGVWSYEQNPLFDDMEGCRRSGIKAGKSGSSRPSNPLPATDRPELDDANLEAAMDKLHNIRSVSLGDRGTFRASTHSWLLSRPQLSGLRLLDTWYLWAHLTHDAMPMIDVPLRTEAGKDQPPQPPWTSHSNPMCMPQRLINPPTSEAHAHAWVCSRCGKLLHGTTPPTTKELAEATRRPAMSMFGSALRTAPKPAPVILSDAQAALLWCPRCATLEPAPKTSAIPLPDAYARELELGLTLLSRVPSSWRSVRFAFHTEPDNTFRQHPPRPPVGIKREEWPACDLLNQPPDQRSGWIIGPTLMRWAMLVQRAAEQQGRSLQCWINEQRCIDARDNLEPLEWRGEFPGCRDGIVSHYMWHGI